MKAFLKKYTKSQGNLIEDFKLIENNMSKLLTHGGKKSVSNQEVKNNIASVQLKEEERVMFNSTQR